MSALHTNIFLKPFTPPLVNSLVRNASELNQPLFQLMNAKDIWLSGQSGKHVPARSPVSDSQLQGSFRGGTRGNAVPIVKVSEERMGTAL